MQHFRNMFRPTGVFRTLIYSSISRYTDSNRVLALVTPKPSGRLPLRLNEEAILLCSPVLPSVRCSHARLQAIGLGDSQNEILANFPRRGPSDKTRLTVL